MIKHVVGTAICLVGAAVAWGSDPPNPPASPIAVTIIWDTSAASGPHWPDYHSICRQCGSSLIPGDRWEIISAHAGSPKLRVSQTIKTSDPQEFNGIYTRLEEIRCPFLLDAHVEKALAMAVTRLHASQKAEGDRPTIVIILTQGALSSREIQALRQAGQRCNELGWKLYVTGTAQSARELLIAANQGLLQWSLIGEANPAAWIQQVRASAATSNSDKPAPSEEAAPEPNQPRQIPPFAVPEDIGPLIGAPLRTGSPDSPITIELTVKRSTDVQPIGVSAPDLEPNAPEIGPEPAQPQQQSQAVEEPNTPAQKERPTSRRPLWSFTRPWPYLAIAVIVVVAALGCLLVQGGPSTVKTGPKDQGELVARINGQTHRLGKPHRLRTIHIGSGPRNTIRVCDKAVSDRHVRLYRRGSNLMIGNIGAKPITVNNLPLAPKGKRLLVLPAVIALSETSTLHLSLLKLKEIAPAGRRDAHEEADSQ